MINLAELSHNTLFCLHTQVFIEVEYIHFIFKNNMEEFTCDNSVVFTEPRII